MNQGQARGIHSRWKNWTNGPVMCPLWGLCCGLSPVRQSRDELSLYSHPLAGWSREDSLSSGLAEFPYLWDTKGQTQTLVHEGSKNKGQVEAGAKTEKS